MTWFAHNLYLRGTERAMQALRARPGLMPFLYLVQQPPGLASVPRDAGSEADSAGLAVVRPITPADEYFERWYKGPILPWDSLHPSRLGPDLKAHVDEEDDPDPPPASLLQYVRELSVDAGAPVLFYVSRMWGGTVCFEASWVFTPDQHTYIEQSSPASDPSVLHVDETGKAQILPGDALRHGLAHIGIHLPSYVFELHERMFPWERHRLGA